MRGGTLRPHGGDRGVYRTGGGPQRTGHELCARAHVGLLRAEQRQFAQVLAARRQPPFNLRHCRDIEGVERKIPLWDPPIDPGLLVRAAAAGVDLASVVSDINAALPNYRFTVMLQKAVEICNEVMNFGAALLSTLEKKDAEGLALLRSQQELKLLQEMKSVRRISSRKARHRGRRPRSPVGRRGAARSLPRHRLYASERDGGYDAFQLGDLAGDGGWDQRRAGRDRIAGPAVCCGHFGRLRIARCNYHRRR